VRGLWLLLLLAPLALAQQTWVDKLIDNGTIVAVLLIGTTAVTTVLAAMAPVFLGATVAIVGGKLAEGILALLLSFAMSVGVIVLTYILFKR